MQVQTPDWWSSLRHGGLLISPSRIVERFGEALDPLPDHVADTLRRDLMRLEGGKGEAEERLLTTVLERVCGLGATGDAWRKGSNVDAAWSRKLVTGERLRPTRLWQGPHDMALPVFFDRVGRLGIGHGRRSVSRVLEWLRATDRKVGLLTNARHWRLIHAADDHDAWCEWDTDLWFEQGGPGAQIEALRRLISPATLVPTGVEQPPRLVAAIEDSRRGQAELSSELGERVRAAVELLVRQHGASFDRAASGDSATLDPRDIYIAATRVIMRLVVVLFAEARHDLLPTGNPTYHASYGLQGLRGSLDRIAAGNRRRLANRQGAWARVLALFRLIHEGSHHPDLSIPRYGGELFAPGDADASDGIRRALAILERPDTAPSDLAVWEMLDLLTRTRVRVRQGGASTWVPMPVDFSDLSSEYIGILYEGLLDYELRRAPDDDAVVFLAVGDEPALPLARVEAMDDKPLAELVKKFKAKRGGPSATEGDDGEEYEGEDAGDEDVEADAAEDDDLQVEEVGDEPGHGDEVAAISEQEAEDAALEDDARRVHETRAEEWASRAVEVGKLVRKPRSRSKDALRSYETAVEAAAKKLVARLVLPGEWFLVLWGGTRKGSGTFYTRPQLTVPTVRRTLQPLAYDPPAGANGEPDEDARFAEWTPREPAVLLALKVCDPACGSGSFPVAALRFLTDTLWRSLLHHGWLGEQQGQLVPTLDDDLRPEWFVECVRDLPLTVEDAEERVRPRLKRLVVERCLYGVDQDPLAIELARLAMWIETMDRDLPFGFLDHKLKVGNALVGCWFDRFRDYPVLAWERKGGDENHARFVHHHRQKVGKGGKRSLSGDRWDHALKEYRKGPLKSEFRDWLTKQGRLFDEINGESPEALHDQATRVLSELHGLPVHDTEGRERLYRERVLENPALGRLREAFDTWCALWFWPADRLDAAPSPQSLDAPSPGARGIARMLQERHRFFHWELEFPDVFAAPDSGFDAIVGNPPWETQQPNSKEFFSDIDPLYRSYGKQVALTRQKELFEADEADEVAWINYNAYYKAFANWEKQVFSPFGDGADGGGTFSLGRGGSGLHRLAADRKAERKGYADPEHPFRHQGEGKPYTYKMFLELGHALLREGGQLGLLVPSGLYTDKGSSALRALFLDRCRWRWLFGFENRDKIFDIHRSFKFAPVIVEKGGTTEALRTAFMRHDPADWDEAERHVVTYTRSQVERFSPRTKALLEIRHPRDLEVLEKIYASSVLLGDQGPDGWGIRYAQGDFNMTSDSKLFPPRPWWEQRGYVPDIYGRWIKFKGEVRKNRPLEAGWIPLADGSGDVEEGQIEDVALPLYQGVMLRAFDASAKGWVGGTGLRASWDFISFEQKRWQPQYLLGAEHYSPGGRLDAKLKIGYREVARSTDVRSFIGATLPFFPCGHKVPLLFPHPGSDDIVLSATGLLNSFTFDWLVRVRLGAAALAWFVLEAMPMYRRRITVEEAKTIAALNLSHSVFAANWMRVVAEKDVPWRRLWALQPSERVRRRCMADAIVAERFGLSHSDLEWILADTDQPVSRLADKSVTRALDVKGFWRVQRKVDPELRHTVLSLVAFHELAEAIKEHGGDREAGIEAFCNQNDGEGWMLPEKLCLADYGLGHDDRAKRAQPVRSRLGDRFYPWQLEQSVEESWAECEIHARNILGEEGFATLNKNLDEKAAFGENDPSHSLAAERPTSDGGDSRRSSGSTRRLFD